MITKKRKGPAPTGKGTLIGVRLHEPDLTALDRAAHDAGKSRPDVVRDALAEWLKKRGYIE